MSKEEKRTRDIMPSDPTDPNEADPQSEGGQEADNVDRSKMIWAPPTCPICRATSTC